MDDPRRNALGTPPNCPGSLNHRRIPLWVPQFFPLVHPTPCGHPNSPPKNIPLLVDSSIPPPPLGAPQFPPPLYGGHPTSSFSIAIHFPVSPIFLLLLTVPQNSPGGDSNPLGRGVIPNKVV